MTLAEKFELEMFKLYRKCSKEVYTPHYFFRAITGDRKGLGTAKWYINDEKITEGFMRLYNADRVDLTVEAWVVDHPEWHPLFTEEELEKAEKRLGAYGYKGKRK